MDSRPIWESYAGGAGEYGFAGGRATGTVERCCPQTTRGTEQVNVIYILLGDIFGK